jgi:hypothetical protein
MRGYGRMIVDHDNALFEPAACPLVAQSTAHVCFWGKSGHDHLRMSAFAVAIGGKADIGYCTAHVYF